MPRKHQNVSVSITPELHKRALERAEDLGFGNSFSAYVQKLIKEDLGEQVPGTLLLKDKPHRKSKPNGGTSRYP